MNGDVIKEFLVGLGFKIDGTGFKRFNASIEQATKLAVKLGAVTTTAAVAVEGAVAKVSRQFEGLYYASQRLNSTVENINATEYAVAQMGGTAQGARSALEGLASFMRSNPGGEGFLRAMGIQTRDANGNLRDTAELLKDLGTTFRGMPYYAARVRANMLGIDEPTLQALIRGIDGYSERYHDLVRSLGVDQEEAAKASQEFMRSLRDLMEVFKIFFGGVIIRLQGPAGEALRNFASKAMGVLGALAILLERALGWLNQIDQKTGGWATTLLALAAVLGPIVALIGGTTAAVIGLVAAIGALIDDFQTWKEGGKSLINWSAWSGEIDKIMAALRPFFAALKDLGSALADIGQAIMKWLGPAVRNIAHATLEAIAGGLRLVTDLIRVVTALLRGDWAQAWSLAKQGAKDWMDSMGHVMGKLFGREKEAPGAPGTAAPAPAAGSAAGRGAQIQAFFRSRGFSAQQALGIAAGMNAENAGFNPDAVNEKSGAYGIGQWLGPRKRELFRRYGPRPSLQQQLEFLAWELNGGDHGGAAVRRQSTAQGALDAYIRQFMRPAAGYETNSDLARGAQYLAGEMRRPVLAGAGGGAPAVQVTQKTDIHVAGGSDPGATARAVAGEQGRVNGDLVRNARGALR